MTGTSGGELLDERSVAAYLVERGVLDGAGAVTVRELSGGVSSIVLAVDDGRRTVVVKQSLEYLRVGEGWRADRRRVLAEGAALRLMGSITPDRVPRVLDTDPVRLAITIEAAPAGARDWRERLLAGDVEDAPQVGGVLGETLGRWHAATAGDAATAAAFDRIADFRALRLDPYFAAAAERRPELGPVLAPYVDELAGPGRCLVHGDFSPKNVLVGAGTLWVIDHEVAHVGQPVFDLAFLLCHLALKSLHRPGDAAALRAAADAFLAAYARQHPLPDGTNVAGHVGCLLLARVHGKSAAGYLDPLARLATHRLGLSLATDPPPRPTDLWNRIEGRPERP
jgi:5-methylthioribose kinase